MVSQGCAADRSCITSRGRVVVEVVCSIGGVNRPVEVRGFEQCLILNRLVWVGLHGERTWTYRSLRDTGPARRRQAEGGIGSPGITYRASDGVKSSLNPPAGLPEWTSLVSTASMYGREPRARRGLLGVGNVVATSAEVVGESLARWERCSVPGIPRGRRRKVLRHSGIGLETMGGRNDGSNEGGGGGAQVRLGHCPESDFKNSRCRRATNLNDIKVSNISQLYHAPTSTFAAPSSLLRFPASMSIPHFRKALTRDSEGIAAN